MDDLAKHLEGAGLSKKESVVYLALLKNGPITGGNLAKLLNMDRTHTYNVIRNLVNKGLADYIVKERKTLFQASSPQNLLNEIEKKEEIVKSIIPDLLELEKVKAKPSAVRVLEGKLGLRTVVRMLLESKSKDIMVYGGTGKSYDALKYEMPHIAKKTELLRMKGRIITSKKLRNQQFTKLSNFKIKYIDELTPSSTMVFDDKVSINVFDDKPFFIVIDNKTIADSYKKYFEYLWKVSKQ